MGAAMLKHGLRLLTLAAPIALGACGSLGIGESEFACAGMPQGVSCLSARQVYEATNNRDSISGAELAAEMKSAGSVGSARPDQMAAAVGTAAIPVAYSDDGRIPIRTPAVVMRVWVAPFTDENGDLHMPGLVFTEIEPRKWQVGLPDTTVSRSSIFQPLQSAPTPPPVVRPASTEDSSSVAQSVP